MLLEQKGARTARPDNNGQTPLSLALSQGHDRVVKTIREWENANSSTADLGGQTPLPPSTGNGDECVVETQFANNDLRVGAPDIHNLPALPSANCNGQEVISNPQDSVSLPLHSDLSTESPRQSQTSPVGPLQSPHTPMTAHPHPNPSKSILSFAVDQLFIISSLICLFAFLLYILPSPPLDILTFRKYQSSQD